MHRIFSAQASNATSSTFTRLSPPGIPVPCYFKKTGSGTCVVRIKESRTGAVAVEWVVGTTDPDAGAETVYLPEVYVGEVASVSGTVAVDLYAEGHTR